jgi:Bacterial type III secretion protein (HrpB4)
MSTRLQGVGVAQTLLLQRLLGSAQHKSAQLATQVHRGWLEAALPEDYPDGALRAFCDRATTRTALLLAEAYAVRWPSLTSLRRRAHRIALLAREPLLRALAAAAFHGRSGDVRRCVGRQARHALVELVGEPAYAALLQTPDAGGAVRAIEAADLQRDACAAKGYQLLQERGLLSCRDASLITRLSLPPGAVREAAAQPDTPISQVQLSGLFDRFDAFFPEQAWMFGSDMDRALSA